MWLLLCSKSVNIIVHLAISKYTRIRLNEIWLQLRLFGVLIETIASIRRYGKNLTFLIIKANFA